MSVAGDGAQSTKDNISSSIKYYHLIRDNLNEIAVFIEEYREESGGYPSESVVDQWVDLRENFHYKVKGYSTFVYYENIPKFVTSRFGSPGQNDYAVSVWDGGEHLFYASWVNGNSADVSEENFKLNPAEAWIHIAISITLLVMLVYLNRLYYFVLSLIKRYKADVIVNRQ